MTFPRTRVSIYEVDEQGATRTEVGQGSLVSPQVVLVHPPQSNHLAAGEVPQRLRVGIAGPAGGGSPEIPATPGVIEVIDVEGGPHVIWSDESTDQVLVGLDLGTPARTPVYVPPGVAAEDPEEEAFRKTAEHLQVLAGTNPAPAGPLPGGSHDEDDIRQLANAWWCLFFPKKCKKRAL